MKRYFLTCSPEIEIYLKEHLDKIKMVTGHKIKIKDFVDNAIMSKIDSTKINEIGRKKKFCPHCISNFEQYVIRARLLYCPECGQLLDKI